MKIARMVAIVVVSLITLISMGGELASGIRLHPTGPEAFFRRTVVRALAGDGRSGARPIGPSDSRDAGVVIAGARGGRDFGSSRVCGWRRARLCRGCYRTYGEDHH